MAGGGGFFVRRGTHEIDIFNTNKGRLKLLIRFQTDLSFGSNAPLAFSPDGKLIYTTVEIALSQDKLDQVTD